MNISSNTITFKSNPIYYNLECSGRKRNTVRKLQDISNDGYTIDDIMECTEINVVNSSTGEYFTRTLTDTSVFDGIVIFSW
jgi:hypothetical protein